MDVLPELKDLFQGCLGIHRFVDIISINTSDGFVIHTQQRGDNPSDREKIAALSGTVSALCSSAAREFSDGVFQAAIVETEKGHLLFVKTRYLGMQSVLTCVCTDKSTLGEARYMTIRLAAKVAGLTR